MIPGLPTNGELDYEFCPRCDAPSRGGGRYWCDHPPVSDPAWTPRQPHNIVVLGPFPDSLGGSESSFADILAKCRDDMLPPPASEEQRAAWEWEDSADAAACSTCRFYQPDEGERCVDVSCTDHPCTVDDHFRMGYCRRRAPVVTPDADTLFPRVESRDWCGEHEDKP